VVQNHLGCVMGMLCFTHPTGDSKSPGVRDGYAVLYSSYWWFKTTRGV
jgi:hypothetical protein